MTGARLYLLLSNDIFICLKSCHLEIIFVNFGDVFEMALIKIQATWHSQKMTKKIGRTPRGSYKQLTRSSQDSELGKACHKYEDSRVREEKPQIKSPCWETQY